MVYVIYLVATMLHSFKKSLALKNDYEISKDTESHN